MFFAEGLVAQVTSLLLVLSVTCTAHRPVDKRFVSAPKHASLKRSDQGIVPSLDFQKLLFYHGGSDDESAMGLSIVVVPKLPMLIHEDIEYYIRNVNCFDDEMTITFYTDDSVAEALSVWSTLPSFVIVTRESECLRIPNEQAPWIVTFSMADTSDRTIHLNATKTTMGEVSNRMYVDIGKHVVPQIDKREMIRRQESTFDPYNEGPTTTIYAPTTVYLSNSDTTTLGSDPTYSDSDSTATPSESAAATETYEAAPTSPASANPSSVTESFVYSSVDPSVQPTGAAVAQDVSFQYIDRSILPPDSELASQLVPNSFQNVNLKCLNCTMAGSMEFLAGGFTYDPVNDDYSVSALEDFFTEGYFNFTASNLAANISFEVDFLPGFTASAGIAKLPRQTLGAIQVAGIITFQPVLEPTFPLTVTLNSPVTVRTGFTLSNIPNGLIHFDINEPANSFYDGFNGTINALPFDVTAPNLSFNISVSFRPQLSLNAGITRNANDSSFEASIEGGAGVYLDIPKLSARVDSLTNSNSDCNGAGSDTYIHVQSEVIANAGVLANVHVSYPGPDYQKSYTDALYTYSYALPEQCLLWDANVGALVQPADSPAYVDGSGNSAVRGFILERGLLLATVVLVLTMFANAL